MSSPASSTVKAGLRKYVVWAPDYTDPGALSRRLAVRKKHLDDTYISWKAGEMEIGGGFLSTPEHPTTPPSPSNPPALAGSMLVMHYPTIEDARKRIERDEYWTGNVWDKERIVISPIMTFDGERYEVKP